MSKRWLIAILLISVSFNLAFIGSIIYLHYIHPFPKPPMENEHRQASRPPFGPPPFERDEEIRNLRKNFEDIKHSLMLELANDPVDMKKVNALIDSSLIAQNILEQKLAERMVAYRKTLSAEEAKEHFLRRAEFVKNHSNRQRKSQNRRTQ
ncbi:MAG TPA: hypothetical protein P5518_01130 [Candidatus Cloacimonas sp.]|jgi:hypothetical protein|nr:periplasmic heavy metal sensor [Candidatus Cloacimonas sp.]MDD2249951.1 hypothetical protein [Candidatus Cloacimonadota bacterium]MCK9157766.1 periplasmic heavy metal sensor [Candidatus Cloacimonas sp.]MCK9165330.1 periplasmic heavy metal sensor [Candidatus Cloacimonas sp.]MDD3733460.1 hypothetical protein [Candidatus Cloacimonadota bacterium]